MNYETEKRSQSEYNAQHNRRDSSEATPYQMLIEQVVTGDRGYLHPVFEGAGALENALEWMVWRNLDGYRPEQRNENVPRETYALGGDDVSASGYARVLLQPGSR